MIIVNVTTAAIEEIVSKTGLEHKEAEWLLRDCLILCLTEGKTTEDLPLLKLREELPLLQAVDALTLERRIADLEDFLSCSRADILSDESSRSGSACYRIPTEPGSVSDIYNDPRDPRGGG